MDNKTNKTIFYSNLGEGISIFLVIISIFLGFGSCNYLVDKGQALKIKAAEHEDIVK